MSGLKFAAAFVSALAVSATAYAQTPDPAPARPQSGDSPWYERFTANSGLVDSLNGAAPRTPWSQSRWSLSVDLREKPSATLNPAAPPSDETAVGAYFRLNSRLQIGGQVSVRNAQDARNGAAADAPVGVRVESAFKF